MSTATLRLHPPRRSVWAHLQNLSVARKIGMVFLGLLLSSALVAVALLWQLQRVNQEVAQATAHSEQRMLWAVRWQALTNQALEVALAGVQSAEEALIASANDKARTLWKAAEQAREAMAQRISDGDDRALMDEAQAGQAQLLKHYEAAFKARDLGQAWEVQKLVDQALLPAAKAQVAVFERLIALQETHRSEVLEAGARQRQAALWWAVAIYGSLLVLGVLVSGALVRSLTRPLHEAVAVARTIAQGDLRVRVDSQRTDEVGVLLQDLGRMARQLQTVVAQVHDGVEAVTEASGQIAAGNGELAERTAQTADHLHRSVERIEEVTLTLMQTAETALQADRLAAAAAASARQGGDAVRDVVDSMQGIAERSREIAAITGVIDGIAFQTNILALNAAVEAARAGSQGRGFAVVATEVRALAQRSAEAAKQIKALIGDSLRQVDGGVLLARQAGGRMQGIVGDVAQVGQLIAEMAQASTAQRDGIAHIHSAVLELDGMTRQNAAMVQACSQATDTMQQEVGQLVREVGVFRLEPRALPRAAVAAAQQPVLLAS
ncbi:MULTISPECIES: methyl-accepting chemotaxis protein [Comamonas]|uniref:methyl-accepting chemotaxis protein n=1 Tax=Comamonas TaxID=283 RepID=UPI00244CAC71|nr:MULTISPECIES: methyl-accepting chemotaxis protein [Comamonas]MDH1292011.1 methyl-accepting chemotaxis protein [Comamonas terrigena]MDH1701779.1 methyl-accepting chemotaxis protein [Comamonas terrigena]MDI9855913.1 methyl-accepting chemotaxis protein [Comamonas sp. 17RB]